VRDFLEASHADDLPLGAAGPQAAVPQESAPLVALGTATRTLVAGLQHAARATTATLDVAATIFESHKQAATVAYDGTPGYQPVVVLWAEQDVVVHDEFRDSHVPAGCGNVRVVAQAVANLPRGITRIRLRAEIRRRRRRPGRSSAARCSRRSSMRATRRKSAPRSIRASA
jgi:hypothetical protein